MAIIEVKVPQLSESVSEATLLDWHKKEGESVARDENLIDIETDKVVLELPAPADGMLVRIMKKTRDSVGSGDVIAQIDTEARAGAAAAAPVAKKEAPAEKPKAAPPPDMPSAQKLAAERGVDTSKVQGTGRDARVTKGDVLEAAKPQPPVQAPPRPALQQPAPPINLEQLLAGRPEQRVPMSRLRQRVAARLLQSQSTAAILTTFNEVNMQPVIELRKKYQERFEKEHGVRLGFMSFFVKAAVQALKKYPVVNASVDGTDIVYHGYYDIGIAVASPRGLVVPIIRDADQLSLADIEKTIADYGKRAQDGKLSMEELTGGTFSLSNGG